MARWAASAKWAAGPALDDRCAMPLALRLSEGLGSTRGTATMLEFLYAHHIACREAPIQEQSRYPRVCGSRQGPCMALCALQRRALCLTSCVNMCSFGLRVDLIGLAFNTPGPRHRLDNSGTCVEKRPFRCFRTGCHMTPTNRAFDMRPARDRFLQRRGFLCRVANCGSQSRSGWLASNRCGRASWRGRMKKFACAA